MIKLTTRAVNQLQKLIKKEYNYIRLDLTKRGCNGWSYTMKYTNDMIKYDELIQQDSIKILIAPNVLMRVIGTIIDYKTNRIQSEFVFKNPNSQGSCGCGESFTTK